VTRRALPSFTIAHWGCAPIRLHLSLVLLAGVACLYFRATGIIFELLGLLTLITVHELGHAVVAHRMRFRVVAIDVHCFGGECTLAERPVGWRLVLFAWGGVLGQLVLLWVPDLLILVHAHPRSAAGLAYLSTFIGPNLLLVACNLLPIRGLDGANAWQLFPLLLRHLKRTRRR
jgi:stage IV sporulation protein FB